MCVGRVGEPEPAFLPSLCFPSVIRLCPFCRSYTTLQVLLCPCLRSESASERRRLGPCSAQPSGRASPAHLASLRRLCARTRRSTSSSNSSRTPTVERQGDEAAVSARTRKALGPLRIARALSRPSEPLLLVALALSLALVRLLSACASRCETRREKARERSLLAALASSLALSTTTRSLAGDRGKGCRESCVQSCKRRETTN